MVGMCIHTRAVLIPSRQYPVTRQNNYPPEAHTHFAYLLLSSASEEGGRRKEHTNIFSVPVLIKKYDYERK